MNYRHNCHKIESTFNFIVLIISIMNIKTRTFYVNVTLIISFHKRRKMKITYFHIFLKFLFIIEQKFHCDEKFEICQNDFYNVFLKQII